MYLTAYYYLMAESRDTSCLMQQDFKQAYAKWFNRSSGGDE